MRNNFVAQTPISNFTTIVILDFDSENWGLVVIEPLGVDEIEEETEDN